jgi:hypothetical protein
MQWMARFPPAELNRVKKDFKLEFDYQIVWNKYHAREMLKNTRISYGWPLMLERLRKETHPWI